MRFQQLEFLNKLLKTKVTILCNKIFINGELTPKTYFNTCFFIKTNWMVIRYFDMIIFSITKNTILIICNNFIALNDTKMIKIFKNLSFYTIFLVFIYFIKKDIRNCRYWFNPNLIMSYFISYYLCNSNLLLLDFQQK